MFVINGINGGIAQALTNKLLSLGYDDIVGIDHNHVCKRPEIISFCHDDIVCGGLKYENFVHHIEGNRIDFINLSGYNVNQTMKNLDISDLSDMVISNVISGLDIINVLFPNMKIVEYGRIILFSSVVAHKPIHGTLGYAATKAALESISKTLFIEGVKNNVTSNCIALGYSEYGMIEQISDDIQDNLKKMIPLKRFCNIDEIWNTIKYCIDTPYIGGQTIHLNGGLYCV